MIDNVDKVQLMEILEPFAQAGELLVPADADEAVGLCVPFRGRSGERRVITALDLRRALHFYKQLRGC